MMICASHACKYQPQRSPCRDTYACRARRRMLHRNLCIATSPCCAHRYGLRHTLCSETFAYHARIPETHRSPRIETSPCYVHRWTSLRTLCTEICVCRANSAICFHSRRRPAPCRPGTCLLWFAPTCTQICPVQASPPQPSSSALSPQVHTGKREVQMRCASNNRDIGSWIKMAKSKCQFFLSHPSF